jgi:phosphoribosylformylglycinamidine synthase I
LNVAVVQFPGSNCEYDVISVLKLLGKNPSLIWHTVRDLTTFDAVILPGGFAHGDYLRPGALARFSPAMDSVIKMASQQKLVLGICNGFQILCEAGLLPGALCKNINRKFICKDVSLQLHENVAMGHYEGTLNIPINHFSGSYIVDHNTLNSLKRDKRIVLTYNDNPNGSMESIAGICNENGNVIGLMPHPERAFKSMNRDGAKFLELVFNKYS